MRTRDLERLAVLEEALACEKMLFEEEYKRLVAIGRDRSVDLKLYEYKSAVLEKKIRNLRDSFVKTRVRRDHYAEELLKRNRAVEESENKLMDLRDSATRALAFDNAAERGSQISEAIGRENTRLATLGRSLLYWIDKKDVVKGQVSKLTLEDFKLEPKKNFKPRFVIDMDNVNSMSMDEKVATGLEQIFGEKAATATKKDFDTDVSEFLNKDLKNLQADDSAPDSVMYKPSYAIEKDPAYINPFADLITNTTDEGAS